MDPFSGKTWDEAEKPAYLCKRMMVKIERKEKARIMPLLPKKRGTRERKSENRTLAAIYLSNKGKKKILLVSTRTIRKKVKVEEINLHQAAAY